MWDKWGVVYLWGPDRKKITKLSNKKHWISGEKGMECKKVHVDGRDIDTDSYGLNYIVQKFYVSCTQSLVEEDQLINLHACIECIIICENSSDNNPVQYWID